MTKPDLPTMAILITAASFAGFAVWLGVNPNALLEAFGIEDRTPQMATEIRAFYGGIEMAIAVAMILLWRRGDLFAALLIGGLPLLGSASGRRPLSGDVRRSKATHALGDWELARSQHCTARLPLAG